MPLDYDRLAADYAQHRRAHPGVLAGLLARAPDSGGAALEVGCGSGNYALALAEHTGCEVWGVDPAAGMLAEARLRAGQAGAAAARVHFREGRAEELGVPAGAFDLVFSVDVIHHVSDRAAYFRQAAAALKPGGWVCTATDSEEIIRTRAPLSVYFPETVPFELRRYPTKAQLHGWMADAGLTIAGDDAVEFPYRLESAAPFRARAYSCLHLIGDEAFTRGLARLEADLAGQRAGGGAVWGNARYVLVWGRKAAGGHTSLAKTEPAAV